MSKKIQSKIEELLFEVYEKGLQQETTDLTAYYEKIKQALNIPVCISLILLNGEINILSPVIKFTTINQSIIKPTIQPKCFIKIMKGLC